MLESHYPDGKGFHKYSYGKSVLQVQISFALVCVASAVISGWKIFISTAKQNKQTKSCCWINSSNVKLTWNMFCEGTFEALRCAIVMLSWKHLFLISLYIVWYFSPHHILQDPPCITGERCLESLKINLWYKKTNKQKSLIFRLWPWISLPVQGGYKKTIACQTDVVE